MSAEWSSSASCSIEPSQDAQKRHRRTVPRATKHAPQAAACGAAIPPGRGALRGRLPLLPSAPRPRVATRTRRAGGGRPRNVNIPSLLSHVTLWSCVGKP